LRQFVGEVSL